MATNSSAFDCVPKPTVAAPPAAKRPAVSISTAKCGVGQVPQPRGVAAKKQRPPVPAKAGAAVATVPSKAPATSSSTAQAAGATCAAKPVGATQFHYAGAYQFLASTGTRVTLDQPQPCLATSDYHTLVEIAAQTSDGKQVIEVGSTVDRGLNGDALPHLFVYHWVNGQQSCYNGCGFVQVSPTRRPGMVVSVTSTPQEYSIQFYSGNWWISYQYEWIGYFPGTLWNNTFTQTGLVQWFGEVAASTAYPCTDMGNGQHPAYTTAAKVNNIAFYGTTTQPAIVVNPTSQLYSIGATSSNSFRYGGAGAC